MLAGLITYQATGMFPPPPAAAAKVVDTRPVDPWAESRASRAILEAQEAAPPAFAPERGGAAVVGRGAAVVVIDGDTFRYGGETIRIADIDTPETHPPRCPYEAQLGARATTRLQVLLGQGGFALRPAGSRDEDRYGRKLRIVERGGRSLGDTLVREGLARRWEGRRRSWCA
jgi:endonuclease YncB( thermonuclease family)